MDLGPGQVQDPQAEVSCRGGRGRRQLTDGLGQDRDCLLIARLRAEGEMGCRSHDGGSLGQQGRGRVAMQPTAERDGNILIDRIADQVMAEREPVACSVITSAVSACSSGGISWLAGWPVMAASSDTMNSRPRTDATFSRSWAGSGKDRRCAATAERSEAGSGAGDKSAGSASAVGVVPAGAADQLGDIERVALRLGEQVRDGAVRAGSEHVGCHRRHRLGVQRVKVQPVCSRCGQPVG